MSLVGYTVCKQDDNLSSLQLIYAEEDKETDDDEIALPWAGAGTGGGEDCNRVDLEHNERISKIKVFGEADKFVTGLALIYDDDDIPETLIGSSLPDFITVEIPDGSNFMGVFGKVKDNTIIELGIIVFDTECTVTLDNDIIV